MCFENVVKTTIFIKDINDVSAVNEIFGRYFIKGPPVRSCVEVSDIPKGAKLEIERIALI